MWILIRLFPHSGEWYHFIFTGRCVFVSCLYLSSSGIFRRVFKILDVYQCVAAMCPKTWYRWYLSLWYLYTMHCHFCVSALNIDLLLNFTISAFGIPRPWYVLPSITLLLLFSGLRLYGISLSHQWYFICLTMSCVVLNNNPRPWFVRIFILPSSSMYSAALLSFCLRWCAGILW